MTTEILDNTGTWMPRQVRAVVDPLLREIKNLKHEIELLKFGRPSAAAVKDRVVFELEAEIIQLQRERDGANGKYIEDILALQAELEALNKRINDSD